MIGRRDGPLMRSGTTAQSLRKSRIAIAIAIGIFLGCVFAFFFPRGFFIFNPHFHSRQLSNSIAQVLNPRFYSCLGCDLNDSQLYFSE